MLVVPIRVWPSTNQILLRYADIGDQGSVGAIATDKTGNIYIVSNVQDESGRGLMRVNKLDPSGNALASFDFGGAANQQPTAAATDAEGNLIVVGTANGTGFPRVNPLFPPVNGTSAFIVKIDSQLQQILFSTLLANPSSAAAVTLDAAGNIYVAGSTTAANFPVTPGAYHTQAPGAFVIEISPNGASLLFATQFGGSQVSCTGGSACIGAASETAATGLAIDSSGAIVFAGNTTALDLPVTPGAIGTTCFCTYNSGGSGFVAKLSAGGGQLQWSTFLNPTRIIAFATSFQIDSLALDASGNPVVGGGALGFQTTAGTVQPTLPAGATYGAFIAKLSASAPQLIWSTYMGGQGGAGFYARVTAIAVNADGEIAFTGYADPTMLPSFPV